MVQELVTDRLLLVGTAHVSPESVTEVEAAIANFHPDLVAVELDPLRLEALEDQQRWQSTPIHKLLKGDKLWLFLTQVLLASYQRRLGEVYGAEPGTEMLAGVRAARAQNVPVLLADRDVGITMKRAFRSMRFREKMRLSWEFFKALLGGEQEEERKTTEELTQEDTVTAMMTELGQFAPSVKTVVLDERDAYLATKLQQPLGEGKRVVAVLGAGHLPGVRQRIQSGVPPADLKALETVPAKKVGIGKVLFNWVLPLLILGVFAWLAIDGILHGNWEKFQNAALTWIVITGTLAAFGTLLARGHPLSILTAFVAAPITTLHPALAAGWFAGIVEAWVRTPTVRDFQTLSKITSMRDFFRNRVIRVVMVAALANLGAMAGFFLAGSLILRGVNFVEWLKRLIPGV